MREAVTHITLIIAVLVALLVGGLVAKHVADSFYGLDLDSVSRNDHPVNKQPRLSEPYGGCDEAYLYPDSRGYRDCQRLGLVP